MHDWILPPLYCRDFSDSQRSMALWFLSLYFFLFWEEPLHVDQPCQ